MIFWNINKTGNNLAKFWKLTLINQLLFLFTFKFTIMSKGKLITGVLTGIAAGAVLGILLAPDKGSETRKKIAKKGNDLSGSVKDGFNRLGENINSKYQNIKDGTKDLAEKTKEKGAELKDSYITEKAF